jgi:hypothetical protein
MMRKATIAAEESAFGFYGLNRELGPIASLSYNTKGIGASSAMARKVAVHTRTSPNQLPHPASS